ncbi:MAG: hypothetical protein ACYTX0_58215, partial [Nostoc sp.]
MGHWALVLTCTERRRSSVRVASPREAVGAREVLGIGKRIKSLAPSTQSYSLLPNQPRHYRGSYLPSVMGSGCKA